MCLAQGHNAVTPVRLELAALMVLSEALYHRATALPRMRKVFEILEHLPYPSTINYPETCAFLTAVFSKPVKQAHVNHAHQLNE